MFEVEVRNVAGEATSVGSAGPYTLVVDRPAEAGGRGLGFNGGQLLYLAVAGCVSNDLFREARAEGIELERVRIVVRGDFEGDPAVSAPITVDIEVAGTRRPFGSTISSRASTRSRKFRTRFAAGPRSASATFASSALADART